MPKSHHSGGHRHDWIVSSLPLALVPHMLHMEPSSRTPPNPRLQARSGSRLSTDSPVDRQPSVVSASVGSSMVRQASVSAGAGPGLSKMFSVMAIPSSGEESAAEPRASSYKPPSTSVSFDEVPHYAETEAQKGMFIHVKG